MIHDDCLLRRYREGSQEAACELYQRYGARVRGLVQSRISPQLMQRIEPEDLVQSVFRRFFERARDGDYHVPSGEDLWGLFLVLTLNRLRTEETFHRALKRDIRRTVRGELLNYALEAAIPQQKETYEAFQLSLEDMLQHLPDQNRAMVELRIEGYEVEQIAQKVGRSKRTVERCLQDVRRKLKQQME